MTTQASDEKKTSAPNLTSVATKSPSDKIIQEEVCRVFISRKTSDNDILGASSEDQRQVVSLVGKASDGKTDRLQFFDADLIKPGANWRRKIRAEIKRADILLLILTGPAQNDFDWPLYEAGLFDSMKEDGRLVCIYPKGSNPPDQLADIQGVKATKASVLKLLKKLFTDKEFTNTKTPLKSDAFDTFPDIMGRIAMRVFDRVNWGSGGKAPEVTYANPFIQLKLPQDKTELTKDVEIESEKRPLRTLFNLNMKPPRGGKNESKGRWTWGDIEKAVDLGRKDLASFNKLWMREAEAVVASLMEGRSEDLQVTSRFIANDKRIWRPEIQIVRSYNTGETTIDISFSLDVQDAWLQMAKAPVALGANLNLAVRIRHDLLETYLRRVPHWQDGDSEHFSDLEDLIKTVSQDGFFIRWLTKEPWEVAFDPDEVGQVVGLERDFGEKVHPKLSAALKEMSVDKTVDALKLWRENNAEFLSIGIPQYTKLLQLNT